jgi:hypothetical protein
MKRQENKIPYKKEEEQQKRIEAVLCLSLVTLPIESHLLSDYVTYGKTVEISYSA